jgi:hypothetical protein
VLCSYLFRDFHADSNNAFDVLEGFLIKVLNSTCEKCQLTRNIHLPCYCNVHVYVFAFILGGSEIVQFFPFIYICIGDPVKRGGIPLTSLTPPHFSVCLMPGPGFPTSCVVICFRSWLSELRWNMSVRFVDIGGIAYHHCLKFLFINSSDFLKLTQK